MRLKVGKLLRAIPNCIFNHTVKEAVQDAAALAKQNERQGRRPSGEDSDPAGGLPRGLSLMMTSTGAKGRRPSGERDATLAHIMLEPSNPIIFGANLTQTLIVSGKYSDGSLRDLTRQASFKSSDPAVATVDPSGTVKAIKNGLAWITAKVERLSVREAIRVQLADQKRAISFVNDIAPVFTRLGCSSSSCHGALNGQHGFKLSLFGYEPETDYKAVVEASDGRRINRAEPAKSLILLKPTQSVH